MGLTGKPPATVLLVDDDPLIRGLGQELLERLGYRVLTAGDGLEALRFYQKNRVDLVILDLLLPEMDGFQVLSGLKARDAGVQVLMTSGFFSSREVARLKEAGASGFIYKPFRLAELDHRIQMTLQDGVAR